MDFVRSFDNLITPNNPKKKEISEMKKENYKANLFLTFCIITYKKYKCNYQKNKCRQNIPYVNHGF